MKLNEKIYSCRKKLGISQEELAERVGVSRQAVSKWELGIATPELDKLMLLARTFGVTADWLLDDERDADEGEKKENPSQQDRVAAAPAHSWVDNLPQTLGRLYRRYGWLAGVYVAYSGAAFFGIGALARFVVRRMFGNEMNPLIANNPVSTMGGVIMAFGAVLFLCGIGLAIFLKRKSKQQ